MKPKINNNITCDKNDWRFMGQDKYLKEVELLYIPYERQSETWDHDHCDFCYKTFSEFEGDQNEGYCTLDKKTWICEQCFNDFQKMFNWKLK